MALRTNMDKHPKSGVYRYRKAVPVELRPYLPSPHTNKREIIITLGTKDVAEAKRLHTLKSEEIERTIFDPARLTLTNVNPSSKHGIIRINMVMKTKPIEDDTFQLCIDHGYGFTLDQPSTPIVVEQSSTSIRSILDLYLEQTSPSEKSVSEIESVWKRFLSISSISENDPITTITKTIIRDFKQELFKYPNVKYLPKSLKSCNPKELLAYSKNNECKTISNTTVKHHLLYLSSVFKWAYENDYITSDPSALLLKVQGDAVKRVHYTDDDIKKIYTSEWFTKPFGEEAWIGLIGLYTGCRQSEITQLLKTDIQKEDGIWFFNVNETDEEGEVTKRIKTISSIRKVPIHDALLSLGILEYVSTCDKHLFATYGKSVKDTRAYSAKWGRMTRNSNVGITSKQKTFHSLRHTLKTKLSDGHTPDKISNTISGHTTPGAGASYGTVTLDVLQKTINKVLFGLDWE